MAWAFMASKPEPTLKSRAMRFLARREHTRVELRRKLASRAQEGEDVESLLDELTRKGWLSDARFAEQAARAKSRRFGPLKLAHYLKSRGVGEEAIAAGLQSAGADGLASLEAVWRTRFSAPPVNEREKLRQVRFLQGRGFPVDDIFKFLKTQPEDR
jgi:regulatory protein